MSRINRRTFLKRAGLVAAAAVVAPKVLFAEKPRYTHKIISRGDHTKRVAALARSMRQTKEQMCANLLNRAFSRRYLT